jgi:hypothetical protein
MMSGMRKPSPISISSPRETITSNRGGVVVHRNTRRANQPLQQLGGVGVAFTARTLGEIVFEIRIAWQGSKFYERRAPEIGVQDHASGVDYMAKGWRFESGKIFFNAGFDRDGIAMFAATTLLADRLQHTPYFVHDQPSREASFQPREARENMIHGRQIAQLFLGGQVTMLS